MSRWGFRLEFAQLRRYKYTRDKVHHFEPLAVMSYGSGAVLSISMLY
jgi:hypothetical protein